MGNVFVKYDPWGRMGNRMFQYAFGRILAERKRVEFYAGPLHNFKNTFNSIEYPFTVENSLSTKAIYGDNYVNYDELLNTDKNIIIDSFLQNANYYTPFKNDIKDWFKLDVNQHILPGPNELVIHIRETDYKDMGVALNDDFYINIIKQFNFDKITIVTDNCRTLLIEKLKKEGCNILSKQPIDKFTIYSDLNSIQDYIYMLYSKYLLIAQSTFSWWPAFLGDHKQVLFPVTSKQKSMWKETPEKNDIDLFINNGIFLKIRAD